MTNIDRARLLAEIHSLPNKNGPASTVSIPGPNPTQNLSWLNFLHDVFEIESPIKSLSHIRNRERYERCPGNPMQLQWMCVRCRSCTSQYAMLSQLAVDSSERAYVARGENWVTGSACFSVQCLISCSFGLSDLFVEIVHPNPLYGTWQSNIVNQTSS